MKLGQLLVGMRARSAMSTMKQKYLGKVQSVVLSDIMPDSWRLLITKALSMVAREPGELAGIMQKLA